MMKQWIVGILMLVLVTVGCTDAPTADQAEVTQLEEIIEEVVSTEIVEAELEEIPEVTEEVVGQVTEEVLVKEEEEAEKEEEEEEETLVEVNEEVNSETNPSDKVVVTSLSDGVQVDEVRGVWLSYLDLQGIFEEGSEAYYRQALNEVVTRSKDLGLNTIMYQVRPFGDALYPSDLFPSSYIVNGKEGDPLTYDPFGIAVEIAHENDLRIEAWINPYRIRTASSPEPLLLGGRADVWLQDGSRRVLQASDGTLVYNPSNDEVRDLIVAGVKEVIDLYQVDGIHFDDYFYPTTEASFDEVEYLGFLHDNDALSHEAWRRSNVNTLIAKVYEVIHETERHIVFGISPYGDIEVNYNQLYADVELWASGDGYVDYLMPQIYFGFNHSQYPYSETLKEWYGLGTGGVKVIPGIAVYKIGKEDQWAGEGKLEWLETPSILTRMILDARSNEGYSGFALYRYQSLFGLEEDLEVRLLEERKALVEILN